MKLQFTVLGPPVPKARPRVTGRVTYTPKRTKDYEDAVRRWAHRVVVKFGGAWDDLGLFEVDCTFYMATNHACDTDNLIKSVLDGMEKVLFRNDNQVMKVSGLRVYGDANPRTEITVTYLGEKPKRKK